MTIVRLACALTIFLGLLCGQPLDSILVLETSPGTEQAIGLIRPSAFKEADRAGVIGFDRTAQVLQPPTENREKLAAALQRAGIRIGVVVGPAGGVQINSNLTVDLVTALQKACGELGHDRATERKRAIIVLFASEDPSLSAHLESLKVTISAANARLYAVVVQRTDERGGAVIPRTGVSSFPVITARLISQLTAQSGGRIFERNWDLREILAAARKP